MHCCTFRIPPSPQLNKPLPPPQNLFYSPSLINSPPNPILLWLIYYLGFTTFRLTTIYSLNPSLIKMILNILETKIPQINQSNLQKKVLIFYSFSTPLKQKSLNLIKFSYQLSIWWTFAIFFYLSRWNCLII
jgi:hypothetical protein